MITMTAPPKTIPEYLDQLRAALAGADPALLQDALYDAEEYLRAELAEHPDVDEATMLASIAGSYGAPEEVADIYRVQETTVNKAMRTPPPAPRRSAIGRFFGVAADPYTYGALVYMLLSLPVGIFYFTWAVTGLSLSAGFAILIIGVPFAVLFMGTVYALSLMEGRIVETLLGERMPRRPQYPAAETGFWARIKAILVDPRTWASLLYMVLMLPLGIFYFTCIVTGLSLSISLVSAPFAWLFGAPMTFTMDGLDMVPPIVVLPLMTVAGTLLLFATLHFARGVGKLHSQFAKHLLVQSA
jgi:uncharacterized membrane protein